MSASVKLMYDIHTENDDTDLKTGQQFHLDYNPGLHLVAKVQFETLAENRPEGGNGWLKLLYSF